MVKLRAYIRRLEGERYLIDLKPIDVPVGGVPCPIPKYLKKEELKTILTYLEMQVQEISNNKIAKYNAYLYRAIIRFLYTTWLRNTELRTLKLHDVNFDQHIGMVLWKGNKYGVITFSETAKEHVRAYHNIRSQMFPRKEFSYVFTPYTDDTSKTITEQWLNKMVKNIGKSAGVKTKTNTHIYRHSLATHLVKDGYTLVEIRDKMRHSNVSITNGYIHSNPVDQMTMTKNIDTKILMDI